MDSALSRVYQAPKTVLTGRDLALLWPETSGEKLRAKISYYVKRGALIRLTRGVFAKAEAYNPRELATSIYTPSYISFETALRDAGIIFQHYDTIFLAGPRPRIVTVDGHTFNFRTLKGVALYNPSGIIEQDGYSIATPERAFLDMIYLFPRYHFDNLNRLDWAKCQELVALYGNRQLLKRLERYQNTYAE